VAVEVLEAVLIHEAVIIRLGVNSSLAATAVFIIASTACRLSSESAIITSVLCRASLTGLGVKLWNFASVSSIA